MFVGPGTTYARHGSGSGWMADDFLRFFPRCILRRTGGAVATGLESGFRLGPWDVRPMLGTLSGPGGTLHLEPKVMNVLVCLAELAGEVVTHDQFIARVWRGRIVSDEVLSRCISLLRTRLGDDPREPRFIQTLPKIGYRLLTPVEPLAAPPAQPAETPQLAEAPQPAARSMRCNRSPRSTRRRRSPPRARSARGSSSAGRSSGVAAGCGGLPVSRSFAPPCRPSGRR